MPLPPGVAPAISATEHKVNWLAPACHARILRVWSPNAMGACLAPQWSVGREIGRYLAYLMML